MKKAQSVGLIGTGSLTDSPLTRFWWLSERLGPVKSASYRVASRIANMLQAGRPVKDYAEFETCELILSAYRRRPFRKWFPRWRRPESPGRESRRAFAAPGWTAASCTSFRRAARRWDLSARFPASTTSAIWWRATHLPSASRKAWWSIANGGPWPSSGL